MHWNIKLANGDVRDVIHWPTDADYSNPAHVRGGNPILFPFCARTFCDGEIHHWRAEDGVKRPMQMHGYARDGEFEAIKTHSKGFSAIFKPDKACQQAYPYDYTFKVAYRFEELAFYVDFELANNGSKHIPWSAGHHFYFTLPWHEGLGRDDYRVNIPARKGFRQNSKGGLEAYKNFAKVVSPADPELSDLLHCKLKQNQLTFGPKNDEEAVSIQIGADQIPPPWTTVVTWSESAEAPFYCVEPWMGPPNSPEHKNGLHFVEPGKTEVFTVAVSLL